MRIVPAKLAVAVLALSMLPATRLAAQTLRPIDTETARVLPSGKTQISLGTTYLHNRRFPAFTPKGFLAEQDLVTAPEIELRVGAGDWVEIQLRYELRYLDETWADGDTNDQFGGGDAEIFTKIRFLREKGWRPAVGAIFGIKLPNANSSDRLGTDETDFGLALLASKEIGPVDLHLNLGIEILGNPGPLTGDPDTSGSGQDDPFTWSLAAVSQPLLSEHTGEYSVRALLSFDGTEGSRFDNDLATVQGGFQLTRGGWTVYGGASGGLAGAAEDYGLRFGGTYAFDLERLAGIFD